MTISANHHDAETRMKKAMDALKHNLGSVRTGRAAPALVEDIIVEHYGTEMPLNQVASVSAPESRLLVIQPWDRSAMGAIEKAIRNSDLGLNPNNDGSVIRLSIPPLTEERRKQMVKHVHAFLEESRVSVRNIRRDAMATIKTMTTDKEISEDDEKRAQDKIEDLTKKYIDEAEAIGKAKEAELLEV